MIDIHPMYGRWTRLDDTHFVRTEWENGKFVDAWEIPVNSSNSAGAVNTWRKLEFHEVAFLRLSGVIQDEI